MLSSSTIVCGLCRVHGPGEEPWIRPCLCPVWYHKACLLPAVWGFEVKYPGRRPLCGHCSLPFVILPRKSCLVMLMEVSDCEWCWDLFAQSCCLVTAEGLNGLFGLLTLAFVYGRREAVDLITSVHPVLAWVLCRYAIPFPLLYISSTPWDDLLLQLFRKASVMPLVGRLMPTLNPELPVVPDRPQYSLSVVSAALLPLYSVVTGRLLLRDQPPARAALLGGVIFTVLTGGLSMYYKQKLYCRQGQLDVCDYPHPIDGL